METDKEVYHGSRDGKKYTIDEIHKGMEVSNTSLSEIYDKHIVLVDSYIGENGKIIELDDDQMKMQDNRFQRYDELGIPYGEFDRSGEDDITQKDKDRQQARILIMSGKSIPRDLEVRLLQYKDAESKNRGSK